MAHLYIIRGLPGSGKTTLARTLFRDLKYRIEWHEADRYWSEFHCEKFIGELIGEAHAWCQENVFRALTESVDAIVSNTFTQIWEMQPYIDYCKEHGHTFSVITCQGPWKSVHNVPDETLKRMKDRWEHYES